MLSTSLTSFSYRVILLLLAITTISLGSVTAQEQQWGRRQVRNLLADFPNYTRTLKYSQARKLLHKLPPQLKEFYHLYEVIIYQNKLYSKGPNQSPPLYMQGVLEKLLQEIALPDVYLILVDRDEMPAIYIYDYLHNKSIITDDYKAAEELFQILEDLPLFMASKDMSSRLEKSSFLLPDKYILDKPRFQSTMQSVAEGVVQFPWHNKLEKAFWRGQPTGAKIYTHTEDEIMWYLPRLFPRAHLVELSKQQPDLLDARFVVGLESQTYYLKRLGWKNYRSGSVPIKDHLQYKYQVSVDGYTAVWERIPWIQHSNCLLFKQKSSIVQWFYNRHLPGVHFVEVSSDLDNLAQKIQYYKSHDKEAKTIAEKGTEFAQKYLTHEAILHELWEILDEFSKTQRLEISERKRLIIQMDSEEGKVDVFDLLDKEEREIDSLYNWAVLKQYKLYLINLFPYLKVLGQIAVLSAGAYGLLSWRRRQREAVQIEHSEQDDRIQDEGL